MLIGLVFQFLMGLTQFGALGILMVLSVPALTAGVLNAMSLAALGLRPPLMTLFIAFSSPERLMRLFLLSAVMIVAGMLSAGLFLSGSADMFDQDLLTRLERYSRDVRIVPDVNPRHLPLNMAVTELDVLRPVEG